MSLHINGVKANVARSKLNIEDGNISTLREVDAIPLTFGMGDSDIWFFTRGWLSWVHSSPVVSPPYSYRHLETLQARRDGPVSCGLSVSSDLQLCYLGLTQCFPELLTQ